MAEKWDYNDLLQKAAEAWSRNELGTAEKLLSQVLTHNPRRPDAQTLLGSVMEKQGREYAALECYRRSMDHAPNYPDAFVRAERLCRELAMTTEADEYQRLRNRPGQRKSFTILLLCYGDFPHISLRALESILSEPNARVYCNVHVGLNQCSTRVSQSIHEYYMRGAIDLIVHSHNNLHKDPMWRMMQESVNTPYIFWMDDDSYFRPGWRLAVQQFIDQMAPFDAAGKIDYVNMEGQVGSEAFIQFVCRRPWIVDPERVRAKKVKTFPVGGAFLARTDFLHQYDFPDRKMLKTHDDIILSELIGQVDGRMLSFSNEIMQHLAISAAETRGNESYAR